MPAVEGETLFLMVVRRKLEFHLPLRTANQPQALVRAASFQCTGKAGADLAAPAPRPRA